MTIKPTNDKAATVDTEYHYLDAKEHPPPRSSKIICINKRYGVATIGQWHSFYTHWAPLPTWRKE